ncbi:hypothetical protein BDZ94DRAFT_1261151 [Collybia nuda]|uniref:F-box domain-containing protein n=1 Tax=Collybia nuda TaxID=64659 RepID=A0A9P5Y3C1_9AGAR|nr:hypothetical protein BDZ94DRAFT_1261151 [Collybia nuda]
MSERPIDRIPFDIWENISHFLPSAVLTTLAEVSQPFHIIATRARYEVLKFVKFDRYTKWLCQNLGDPKFGRCDVVRRLEITPWLVKPRVKSYRNQGVNLWRIVTHLFDPDCETREMNELTRKRVKKEVDRISEVVKKLSNVTEYKLGWDQNRGYHPEFFHAFLCPVLTRMWDRLVILSLKVPPEALQSLASISLPRLQELEVTVCTLDLKRKEVDGIFDSFTVFVNNLFPTLRSLCISSVLPSQFLDFSRFFNHLGFFPQLDTFRFSIPFDGAHLSSPVVLSKFLTKHQKTLRHLQLTVSRCGTYDIPLPPSSKYWIPNILASLGTPGPQLHEIHLALRPLKADLAPVASLLRQHARTLKSLTLVDRRLTYQEVQFILDAVIDPVSETCSLRHLHLRICHLSPPFLDLLSSRLPRLAHLELDFAEVVATAAHVNSNYPAHSKRAELTSFKKKVWDRRASYAEWELETLSVSQGPSTYLWLAELQGLFEKCVPGLQFKELLPSAC